MTYRTCRYKTDNRGNIGVRVELFEGSIGNVGRVWFVTDDAISETSGPYASFTRLEFEDSVRDGYQRVKLWYDGGIVSSFRLDTRSARRLYIEADHSPIGSVELDWTSDW
jgi:hypothetical protein